MPVNAPVINTMGFIAHAPNWFGPASRNPSGITIT